MPLVLVSLMLVLVADMVAVDVPVVVLVAVSVDVSVGIDVVGCGGCVGSNLRVLASRPDFPRRYYDSDSGQMDSNGFKWSNAKVGIPPWSLRCPHGDICFTRCWSPPKEPRTQVAGVTLKAGKIR